MSTLNLNGNLLQSGDPTLKLDRPYWAHPSIEISTNSVSNPEFKWVYLTLPLSAGTTIKGVQVYFQTTGKSSICQTRITWQTFPNVANVVVDDATNHNSATPASYTVNTNTPVNGSMVLELRLNFVNTTDLIMIGAIEIAS